LADYMFIVYTKLGKEIHSDTASYTDEEIENVKELMSDLLAGSKGQLNVSLNGNITWIPIHAIDNVCLKKL
jgi:hypothetical protein